MIKFNKLAAAIAATTLAGQALALDVNVDPIDIDFQISGATAANKQVNTYISSLCDINTQVNYNDVSESDEALATFCTVPASAGLFATDKNVLFRKENGGSSTGVSPVSTGGTVLALDTAGGGCVVTTPPGGGVAGEGTCPDAKVNKQAQVGVSDVEPELFTIPANGAKTVDTAALGSNVYPVNVQTFGIVVSPGLRDALQAAQGLTVGSDDYRDMPSLSRSLIANIFAGNVGEWTELKTGGGNNVTTGAGLSNSSVNVCVRTPGSGTQAQFNAYYLGNACNYRGASTLEFVGKLTAIDGGAENDSPIPTFFGTPQPGPHIHKNKGSSDMGKCLTNVTNDGRWAIGIQSLEKVDEARTNRNEFKYVAIDGVAPTLENVATGRYSNVASLTIQWNDTVVTPGSDLEILANEFVSIAQNLGDVAAFNLSLQTDDPSTSNDDRAGGFTTPEILDGAVAANVGSLAFPAGSVQPSFPFSASNPVASFNQGASNPSSCAIPTYVSNGVDVTR